ncbi:MAG: ion channel [Pseudobdellovibrio sp.]
MSFPKKIKSMSDLYHHFLKMDWVSFILFNGTAYVVVNLFFGFLYYSLGREGFDGIKGPSDLDFFKECFFFSIQTFSTIGYGYISPIGFLQNVVVAIEAFSGLISIGMISGLFFARFTRPDSKVAFSNVALLTPYLGKPSLLFRLANERGNQIIDAKIQVSFMQDVLNPEGNHIYKLTDLPVIRARTPVFYLSWTVCHHIDQSSPLFNLSLEEMKKSRAQILVLVIGYDDTFNQTVHARYSYHAHDLIKDRQFVDIIVRTDHGSHVDVDKISKLKPI